MENVDGLVTFCSASTHILNVINKMKFVNKCRLLNELISEIDAELYKKNIKGKWSIHEHATHIAIGDMYGFQKRLKDFREKEKRIALKY